VDPRCAAGKRRRRKPEKPGQVVRRGRFVVPGHGGGDPQREPAVARNEAAHAGRARGQRPVAHLGQGPGGGTGHPRRSICRPDQPDGPLCRFQRAQQAPGRPDLPVLRLRHRARQRPRQGMHGGQLQQPAHQHETRPGQILLERGDGLSIPGQIRQGERPPRRGLGDRLHGRVLRPGERPTGARDRAWQGGLRGALRLLDQVRGRARLPGDRTGHAAVGHLGPGQPRQACGPHPG
jgi:hypothetical protein